MKILYFADFIAGCGLTPQQEFENFKNILMENGVTADVIDCGAKYIDIEKAEYDICVFDYVGILPGASGLISSISRLIIKAIEDNPSKLFIAWTSFTNKFLRDEAEKELGNYPNFIVRELGTLNDQDKNICDKIKKWIK